MPADIRSLAIGFHMKISLAAMAMGVFILTSLIPTDLYAQYFSLGTDPSSVRWLKIKTEHFKVIFPASISPQAQYIASGFEYFYKPGSMSLSAVPKRFPVILHNQSVYSNAFVPYAPKRIEFLMTGPQDNYAQDWIDQLIIHEFRHAVQYTAVDRGFTRGMSWLFGQQAVPAVIGLFVPLWFIEGDATVIETAAGIAGRGRLPSFGMKLKAQFLEKGIYHYDKAVHGSFRDFVPNRYELGYQLVGRTRTQFGRDVWAGVMKTVGRYPFMLVPFSHSLKKQTGLGKVPLYHYLASGMKREWKDADGMKELTGFLNVTKAVDDYTNYKMPALLDDGSVVAIKTSLDDIPRIVRIDPDGSEKTLVTPGTGFFPDALTAAGSILCWSEAVPDPRWTLRDYAVIKTYDISTGKMTRITRRSRLFAPAIDPLGETIIAVEITPENLNYLVILDAATGQELQRTGTPGNLFLAQPAWSEKGNMAVCVTIGKEGKSLLVWDIGNDTVFTLLPFTTNEISRPSLYGNHVIYSGGYEGTDDLFAYYLPTGQVLRLTTSRFGAVDAAMQPGSEYIFYSDYTANGYRIVKSSLESLPWRPQYTGETESFPLAEALAEQEGFTYAPDSVPDTLHEATKYRKGLNLFNFHSWAPVSFNADNLDINPGVMLLSQNLLGTSYFNIGYEYDLNEETGKYYLNYTYSGLYPSLGASVEYGPRRGTHEDDDGEVVSYEYRELDISGVAGIPLNWSAGAWYIGGRPQAGYTFKALEMDPGSTLEFRVDRVHAAEYNLFIYTQKKSSFRDLQPRLGHQLQIGFMNTLFDSAGVSNTMFSSELLLYLPGIGRHHGIRAYTGYQKGHSDYYNFANQISTVRGYTGVASDEMLTLSASYLFPIFYPDWRLGPVLYVKRFKGAVFYDQTFLMDITPEANYNTVGLDLTADFHLFSFLSPLELGLRSMFFPRDKAIGFQLLWGFNIDSLY